MGTSVDAGDGDSDGTGTGTPAAPDAIIPDEPKKKE